MLGNTFSTLLSRVIETRKNNLGVSVKLKQQSTIEKPKPLCFKDD